MKVLFPLIGVVTFACASANAPVKHIENIKRSSSNDQLELIQYNYFGNEYGKVSVKSYVAKKEFEKSNFYVLVNEFEFMPGVVLSEVESTYNKEAYNEKGHVSIDIDPYNESKINYGSLVYGPVNGQNFETSVTSNFNHGIEIGVSKKDGFYINGSLFARYAATTINKEPVFSSQKHDYNEVSYVYDYTNAANETYHLNTYVNFEVSKEVVTTYVSIDVGMVSYIDKWFNWEQELFEVKHEPFILKL